MAKEHNGGTVIFLPTSIIFPINRNYGKGISRNAGRSTCRYCSTTFSISGQLDYVCRCLQENGIIFSIYFKVFIYCLRKMFSQIVFLNLPTSRDGARITPILAIKYSDLTHAGALMLSCNPLIGQVKYFQTRVWVLIRLYGIVKTIIRSCLKLIERIQIQEQKRWRRWIAN